MARKKVSFRTGKGKKYTFFVNVKIRPEIRYFAEAMEKKMSKKDKEKSDSWKYLPVLMLRGMLTKEFSEWNISKWNTEKEAGELVDIGNHCMMLRERILENLKQSNECKGDENG